MKLNKFEQGIIERLKMAYPEKTEKEIKDMIKRHGTIEKFKDIIKKHKCD